MENNEEKPTVTFEQAVKELEEATRNLIDAAEQIRNARRLETEAINRVNAKQAQLDKVVGKLKAGAPPGTDWHKPKYTKEARL